MGSTVIVGDESVQIVTAQVDGIDVNAADARYFFRGRAYFPDYNETDQGDTGDSKSVKAYVDAIDSDSATLVFQHNSGEATTTYTFSTDETIPDNIHVIVEKGAILSTDNTFTLTINSFFDAGLYQVFSGDGSVAGLHNLYPQWFGACADDSTDNAPMFARMYRSISALSAIIFHSGAYRTSEPFTPTYIANGTLTIRGVDSAGYGSRNGGGAVIYQTDPTKNVVELSAPGADIRRRVHISGMRLIGGNWGIYTNRISHSTIEKVHVRSCVSGIYIAYGWGNRIDDCRIETMSGEYGIQAINAANSLQITRNYISGIEDTATATGIVIDYSALNDSYTPLIQGNIIESCSNGILAQGRGGLVQGNYFEAITYDDIIVGTSDKYASGYTFIGNSHNTADAAHVAYSLDYANGVLITGNRKNNDISHFVEINNVINSNISANYVPNHFVENSDSPTSIWRNTIHYYQDGTNDLLGKPVNAIEKSILFWTRVGVAGSNTVCRFDPANISKGRYLGRPVLDVRNYNEAAGVGVSYSVPGYGGFSNISGTLVPITAMFDVFAGAELTVQITLETQTITHTINSGWHRIGIASYRAGDTIDLEILNMTASNTHLYIADTPQLFHGIDYKNACWETLPFKAVAAPTDGTWAAGDIVWDTDAAAGATPGWYCVTAGSPGTWKAMGTLAP